MASSNEVTELKLISSIRFKLANVSGDEKKLSDALKSQLVPLLEKAGSQHKAVRDAAFQAFISVNNFIKPVGVVLPVAGLVQQYKSTGSPIVKQLDLSLIKQGILRLDQPRRRELLPVVLRGISKETSAVAAAGFFNIFLRLLLDIKLPGRGSTEDLALRETTGITDPADARYVSQWLGKLFLLKQELALATDEELDRKVHTMPSGLSREDINFLRNNNPHAWRPGQPNSLGLPECKIKAVSFLATGAFTDSERHMPAICAAGSADSRITSIADDILKRSNVDLEDKGVIKSLYDAHREFPVSLRIQVLRRLSKSVAACSFKTEAVEAVKDDFKLASGNAAFVFGFEALRLNKALLAFLSWIARNGSSSDSSRDMGPELVITLKDYVLQQGWPDPAFQGSQSQIQDEQKLRANAYETIGILARGSHFEHMAKDSLLKWLFDSLVSDPTPDIVVYVESALSNMIGLFKPSTSSETRDLEILLSDYMDLPVGVGLRTARHVATRFANNCLPYNNIQARWIDILAITGGPAERRDVMEEGLRGLDPWWATKLHPDEKLVLPDWARMAKLFFKLQEEDGDRMVVNQVSRYAMFPDARLQAFPTALRYVKQILLRTALTDDSFEVGWQSQGIRDLQTSLSTRSKVTKYLSSVDYNDLLRVLNAAFDGLRDHPWINAEEYIKCLAQVLPYAPSVSVVSMLSYRTPELLPAIKLSNQKARQLASKVFGILAPLNSKSAILVPLFRSFVEVCQEPSAAQSAEYQGSLACLGNYLSRAAYYGIIKAPDVSDHAQFLYKTFTLVLQKGKGSADDIAAVAIDSMAQLWAANLHFPHKDTDLTNTIDLLAKLAASGNEKAIGALGRLAIPDLADVSGNETDPLAKILDKLFELSEIKRTEVHFATGEAIACAIARWDSDAVRLSIDVEPVHPSFVFESLKKRPSRMNATIDKLIADCKTTKPSLLKASGIWLFCIIQYCSHLPEIQARLRECQVAFMRLLTARDELVQETASRGLALAYEKGDESLKGDLVRDLVASFTGSRTQLKVDDDTELFDAGALPTGEGKSVTSYKDIISLANEVGDQSLVYKFMALATNAATWTVRSAFGRFGLSNILSDVELDPKIYPKLYRYRFDPNSNVRRSMDDIWKAVVKDQTVVVDKYFDAIMNDLLKSILDGREWRVREASCTAIAELIYGKPFPKYEKYYTDIWRVTLRVVDDQKGSVRSAALKLCISLSKTLVTQLQENNNSASAKAMIAQVLPFLLSDKGIENSVQDVKAMSIRTVLDIVKNGGDALKPFIPTIITHFLGLLSTVEPEVVNYYYQRVSEEDREGLDKLRTTAATRSPLFECVFDCLRFVDDGVMKELAPQLVSTIKSAIGMQTKVGCSEVLSTLAIRHSILLPPYSAMFMRAMETQILDRNHEANKAYARSSAYLLRSAPLETRERFTSKLLDLYFGAEDETRRQKVADAVLSIAKVSPDAFTDLEARLLPFAYLGKHDTDEYVSEEFEAVWSQYAGGSHTVKRFVNEITHLAITGLNTSKWALQHGAALTMASMVTALSSAVGKDGQLADADLRSIWPVLDRSLLLKTFTGKEKLVTAYPLFVSHGKSLWSADQALAAQMKKIAFREAKRNNDEYRPHAFQALAQFAKAREDLDMYMEVVGLVASYLRPDEEAHKITELERSTADAALKVALTAYNRQKMRGNPITVLDEVATIAETAKKAISLAKDTWFTCVADIMNEVTALGVKSGPGAAVEAARWFRLLVASDREVILENQRISRVKALSAFVQAWKAGAFGPDAEQGLLHGDMENKLKEMREAERSLDVQKLIDQVIRQLF